MSTLTDARVYVRDALVAGLAGTGISVYDHVPSVPTLPAVGIRPGGGAQWQSPRGHVFLELVIWGNGSAGTAATLTSLETTLSAVQAALHAAKIGPGGVNVPESDPTSGLLLAAVPVTVYMQCP